MAHLYSIDFGTDVVSEAQYAPICSGTASAQLHRRNGCRCRQARQADHVGDEPEGTPVRYMRSIFIPGEDKCYCRFEGESADTVRQAALAAGSDFDGLAREHSGDQATAASGGDLGFVARGQTVPPFEDALFGLEPGSISGVVESPFGFHVIKAEGRRDARLIPFDEASAQIRLLLLDQARQALMVEFIARLRASGEIEIHI